jgi:hypothetical protein
VRYDKYDPVSGGFRAPLNFAIAGADIGALIAVGLNASGRVVKGAGNTGVKGVICMPTAMAVGDIADVMTDGEIVHAGLVAGTNYYGVAADGTVNTTNTNVYLGHTVEADRLVVRVAR